ncbi:SepM family pheromone-processing serine protease [Vagococcus salmoninarum]|uniref:SepM family pheromone-processing serine protease n=1 Tax=Vagococcus salmoninarum TaxID=2739 RepID=UPI00187E9302|nr:SepM family pheromone-processing serine protease [Vagococcus salmoninarum]MBE9389784.1 PDZ domain-containing protein [Vagococcus salmoninarum]
MKNNKRELLKSILMIVLSVMVIASVVIRLPYYIEVPGSAENVRDFVSVDGQRNNEEGSYMLTTVGIRQGTLVSLIAAKFLPFQEIVSKQDLMGESTDEEFDEISKFQMTSSENMAKKVALDLAKEPYEFQYKGVYVLNVLSQSKFAKELKMGDIVYQVDEQEFKNSQEFMDYVSSKKVGEELTIKFRRDGVEKSATGALIELEGQKRAGIGITLVDHSELETQREVNIKTEDIGGPSAGLMFTLELYDLLASKDSRKGREIAGTGTINEDGTVGSIGGIDKKIVAADRAGATIFFAPAEEYSEEIMKDNPDLLTNYQEAVIAANEIKTKMKVVPVKTVHDALDYLEKN